MTMQSLRQDAWPADVAEDPVWPATTDAWAEADDAQVEAGDGRLEDAGGLAGWEPTELDAMPPVPSWGRCWRRSMCTRCRVMTG